MAYVETQFSFSGNHISHPGLGSERADRSHQTQSLSRMAFHGCNPRRRSGDRIMAKIHGCCSRMIGFASETEHESTLTGNCLDHAKGMTDILKYWPLFDVELQIADCIWADSR